MSWNGDINIDNIEEIIFMFIEHGSQREWERDENCSEHDAMGNIFTEVKQKSIFKIAQKVSSHASAFITKLLRAYRKLFKCILNREKKNYIPKNKSENTTWMEF